MKAKIKYKNINTLATLTSKLDLGREPSLSIYGPHERGIHLNPWVQSEKDRRETLRDLAALEAHLAEFRTAIEGVNIQDD